MAHDGRNDIDALIKHEQLEKDTSVLLFDATWMRAPDCSSKAQYSPVSVPKKHNKYLPLHIRGACSGNEIKSSNNIAISYSFF